MLVEQPDKASVEAAADAVPVEAQATGTAEAETVKGGGKKPTTDPNDISPAGIAAMLKELDEEEPSQARGGVAVQAPAKPKAPKAERQTPAAKPQDNTDTDTGEESPNAPDAEESPDSEETVYEDEPEEEEEAKAEPTPGAKLYAGTFKSPEELEKGYTNLTQKLSSMGNELGELRKLVETQNKEAIAEAPKAEAQQFDPETGFPLDDLGVPYRPDEWWATDRWEQILEWAEGDERKATAYYNREQREWNEQYARDRQAKLGERQSLEDREVAELAAKQTEEIPKAKAKLKGLFLKVHPEDEAEAKVEKVWQAACGIVKDAYDKRQITAKDAAKPETVHFAIGEALKQGWLKGELDDLLAPSAGDRGRVQQPQSAPNGGGAKAAPQARNGTSGSGSAKRVVRITQEDKRLAEVLGLTPEEIAEDRLANA